MEIAVLAGLGILLLLGSCFFVFCVIRLVQLLMAWNREPEQPSRSDELLKRILENQDRILEELTALRRERLDGRSGGEEISSVPADCMDAEAVPEEESCESAAEAVPKEDLCGISVLTASAEESDSLEGRTRSAVRRIVNWICVGEDFRPHDVAPEYAVATTWLIRCGILILLCGIGFFLKYSIENSLLSPAVRLSAAAAAGILMFAGGYLGIGKKYSVLAMGIMGAGVVTGYFSVFAGFRLYHLFDSWTGMIAMVGITVVAILAALRKNVMHPAVIATAGGYLTPVLLSSGSGSLPGLYVFTTVLGAGVLAAAWFRNWKPLNIAAFVLSSGIYALTLGRADRETFAACLVLLLMNYLLFSLLPLMYQILSRQKITQIEIVQIVLNQLVCFALMILLCFRFNKDRTTVSLLLLAAGAVPLVELGVFFLRKLDDAPLRVTLFGMTVVSLAAFCGFYFSGGALVASWSAVFVLLIELGLRFRSRSLKLMSVPVALLTGGYAVCRTWWTFGSGGGEWENAVKRFFLLGVFDLALLAAGFLFRHAERNVDDGVERNRESAGRLFFLAAVIFLIYSSLEIIWFFHREAGTFTGGALALWWSLFAFTTAAFGIVRGDRRLCCNSVPLLLMAFGATLYQTVDSMGCSFWVEGFIRRFPVAVIFLSGQLMLAVLLLRSAGGFCACAPLAFWGFGIPTFLYTSVELYQGCGYFAPLFRAGAVSIWWGLLAIGLLFGGSFCRKRLLRRIGGTLFAVCMIKVFLNDLASLGTLSRIIAFIVLGLIFLGGAILYIRFRDRFEIAPEDRDQTL